MNTDDERKLLQDVIDAKEQQHGESGEQAQRDAHAKARQDAAEKAQQVDMTRREFIASLLGAGQAPQEDTLTVNRQQLSELLRLLGKDDK
jgi:hypothetical protein